MLLLLLSSSLYHIVNRYHLWCVCSVRSSRHRELDSTVPPSGRLVANSTQSVTPQRQFCTSVERSDVAPAPAVSQNVNRNMRRYSGAEFTASSTQDFVNAGGRQLCEAGDRRPFSGTESVAVNARLSDDDYHSPDSAYHSSHGSGNSSAWNGAQGFNSQLAHHRWWPPDVRGPTQSRNHEKSPSCPVTQSSAVPASVGGRASSWTDNTRTNNAEVCSRNQAEVNWQVEDGLQPHPHVARQYFEDVATRLHEQQSRHGEFQARSSAFHPINYAVGYHNSIYPEQNSVRNSENNSTNYISANYGKVDAGWVRSFQSPGGQECSPGPPPLPATSPPHDPPPRYMSSSTRSVSSSDMDKLITPYNAASHRDVFDTDRDRQSLTPSGPGMPTPVSATRVESFSETSIQPHREQNYSVNGRRYVYKNGSGNVAPVAAECPTQIAAVDEDDLRSRLDKLPASQSQTSVLRRLSQEFFGASRSRYGINPPGRMSLGSASSCLSTSGTDLSEPAALRNVDGNYQHPELESPTGVPGSCVPGPTESPDDAGTNFVRTRKTQMSLRKAFGIFDDFDVAETEAAKQLPVLTEDEAPSTVIPSSVCNDSDGLAASENHRVTFNKGRRSSESEFHRKAGDSRNFDRVTEKPAVISSALMQRSMSLGSDAQAMMSFVPHGVRLSTASDAHSTHSSSSGSTNGVRSSLDLSTGSSARSADLLPGYGPSVKESGDPVKLAKAKSKSLPRDAPLPSDPGPAMSFPQSWHQHQRPEV